jgi:hypothetical protein
MLRRVIISLVGRLKSFGTMPAKGVMRLLTGLVVKMSLKKFAVRSGVTNEYVAWLTMPFSDTMKIKPSGFAGSTIESVNAILRGTTGTVIHTVALLKIEYTVGISGSVGKAVGIGVNVNRTVPRGGRRLVLMKLM